MNQIGFLHEFIRITKNLLIITAFSPQTKKIMLTNNLHFLNVLVS